MRTGAEHGSSPTNNFLSGCPGFHSHRASIVFSALFRVLSPLLAAMQCTLAFRCQFWASASRFFLWLLPAGFISPEASQPHGKLPLFCSCSLPLEEFSNSPVVWP